MNVIKFNHNSKEGYFSIIELDGRYHTLAERATPKVQTALDEKELLIAYDVKNPTYHTVEVEVSTEMDFVGKIYKLLEESGNLYFDALDESLCVISIPKEV